MEAIMYRSMERNGHPYVLAKATINGSTWYGEGETKADARRDLMETLSDLGEISPESFVVLPPPVPKRQEESMLKRAALIAFIFVMATAALGIMAFILSNTK